MYKIAICDDEKQVRESIRDMLGRYATENGCTFQCTLFDSATSLLRDYRADLDILFLDISMQGLDGMDAAREIRKRDDRVCIIFVTSMYQYAIEGYSVHAFGFVTKPMHYQELSMELDSALRAIDGARLRETAITLRSGTQIDRLPVSGILYCEVRNHTVAVHLYGEIRSYRYSMKEMETMLGQYGFFRPHSAYLVNHAAIAQVLGFRLMLKNGEELPISQQRRRAFLSDLTGYIG